MSAPTDSGDARIRTVDPADPELLADPSTGYGRIREQAPVRRGSFLDGSPIWLVTRYDDVTTVLSDSRFANDARSVPGKTATTRADQLTSLGIPAELTEYLANSILDVDPPDHTRLRKLVSRAFTVRRVAELRPRVTEIAEELLSRLPGHAREGTVDLIENFAYPLPITVICELVGVPEEDRPQWRDWGRRLITMVPDQMGSALAEIVEYTHRLVDRRRRTPSHDLISGLIQTHDADGDRLSDTELVTMVLTLVIAGHETTAHLIGNGTAALLTRPDQLALLRADPRLLPAAVHEAQRWCGPILFTRNRHAVEDVTIGDTVIRQGEMVMAVLVSANHDPRHFTDPERFDILRTTPGRGEQHVGFGHGPHYCLGAALARQETEVAFSALFDRYPDLALAVPEEDLEWVPVPGNRRLAQLPVQL